MTEPNLFDESESFDEDYFEDDGLFKDCPKCSRDYDSIDYEFQSCSKCGWDESNKKWTEPLEPTDEDFMSGDADILTGQWN